MTSIKKRSKTEILVFLMTLNIPVYQPNLCSLTGGWRQSALLLAESLLVYQPTSHTEQTHQMEALTDNGMSLFLDRYFLLHVFLPI